MANEVRIRTSIDDKASGPLGRVKDKFDLLGKSGGFKALVQGVGLGVGAAAFNMLGSAAGGAADFIGDSIEASRDLTESLSKSKAVFGDSSKEIEAFGATTAHSMGISKQAAIDAAGSFGALFTGLDIARPKAAEMSETFVTLAGDLASFYNLDPGDALTKLQSGLAGESEPLRKVGIFLTEAKVKAKAMELGLVGLNGEVTEAGKVQARYQLILEGSTIAQGDAARTIGELAGQQRVAAASLIDAQAELGKSFEPIALQVTEWQIDFLKGLGVAGDGIRGLGSAFEDTLDLVTFWDGYTNNALGNVADGTNSMALAVKDDLIDVRGSTNKTGDTFEDLADTAKDETKKVVVSFDDMVDALSSDVGRLIDDVRDPAIQAAELQTQKEEDAALRRVIKSHESNDEEIRDARRRRLSLKKEMEETRLALLESGNLSAADTKSWLGQLEREYAKATGSARADIGTLIAQIEALSKITAKDINVVVKTYGLNLPGTEHRASGGPIDPKKVYMVGENGPELFASNDAGSIIPNHQLGGVGPMNMGTNVAIHIHGMAYPPSPAQQREMAQNMGPALREYLDRRG